MVHRGASRQAGRVDVVRWSCGILFGPASTTCSRLVGRAIPTDTPCVATCGRPKKSDGRPCDRRAGMASKDHGALGALSSTSRCGMSQPRPTSFASTGRSTLRPNATSSTVLPQSAPEPRPSQPQCVRDEGCSHYGRQNLRQRTNPRIARTGRGRSR